MGCRELGSSLLILLFLINFASSSPKQKSFPPESLQKIKVEDNVIYGSKMEGSHTGTNGGKTPNIGENGGSTSPNTPGGTAAIIGGAANNNRNHQNHRGAASCNLDRISFTTMLIIITLVSPLIKLFC
ncbi:hypothetical protein L6164_008641 [Bauhinia variegata]|uniref:Uncharacterized protein n=1 Tax=Bauhinia variegata TaxID=167791 RepID=A0ACB9PG85_BAUVA|nr:hypothetical protein L6164_008641 [Bauhinia variegata]